MRGFLIGLTMGAVFGPLVLIGLARWRWKTRDDFVEGWDTEGRRYQLLKHDGVR